MRWVVVSLVVHAVVIAWFACGSTEQLTEWHVPVLPAYSQVEAETWVDLIDEPATQTGGGGAPATSATATAMARSAPVRSADAWEQIDIQVESTRMSGDGDGGSSGGDGGGIGGGHGRGIGFGDGAGVHAATDVPAPPAPPPDPPVSKARPAKLVWPTRDEEVDDEASLFVAKITVDANGDVVGARMMTLRPGVKADRAASAIWTFRYSPALDDEGRPARSTFEQSFQIR